MSNIKLALLLATVVTTTAIAQVEQHVSWTFKVQKLSDTEANLIFTGKCEKDWHYYTQKDELNPILFTFKKSNDYQLVGKPVEWPKPKAEFDELMEANRAYYEKEGSFTQKIKILSDKNITVKGTIEYQACLLDGMCVMEEQDFALQVEGGKIQAIDTSQTMLPDTLSADSSLSAENKDTSVTDNKATMVEQGSLLGDADGSLWILFFFSFLAGLAAILTPCVFPMIPMTVSFFMHNSENKRKARFQAFVYGISIILIYTVIGTLVAVTMGPEFANFLSTHWIPNIFFFLIFIIFAASFFGMFEITLPSWLVNKADKGSEKGGISGSFFMAFTLVLVSFSCTGPIVGAILVESAGGKILEPIIGMLGFSLAFAIPFTLFAFFPSWLNSLPKSGGWLNSVKVVLGFIELALGIKFLSVADQTYHWGMLDREIYLAIWIVIFALMGFYLLGKIKFAHDSEVKHISVPRLVLVIATFSFVVYMIPGMWGAPLKFLSGYLPPMTSQDFDIKTIVRENSGSGGPATTSTLCDKPKYSDGPDPLHLPHGIQGYFDYDQALACAREQGKPLFIDFTGHGCVNCRKMEEFVWVNPKVLSLLKEKYVVVTLFVDDKKIELPENEWVTDADGDVLKTLGKKNAWFQISKYNINAQPYYVLLDNKENMLLTPRAYDLDIDAFVKFLEAGIEEFGKREK